MQTLEVFELVKDGNWISLKKMRILQGQKDGEWKGSWHTFETPVKLLPAYIPTEELRRNDRDYPEDVKWRGKTVVIGRWHEQRVDRAGRITRYNKEETGGWNTALEFQRTEHRFSG